MSAFSSALVRWQRRHGRHGLPWQASRDPYRVWLSEVMLQQTQVATVLPYYERFTARFPDVHALAAAPLDEVLGLWSGLGYYARGRALHAAAQRVVGEHGGRFPDTAAGLETLPGIGPSTAAAIAAFCHGERAAILDGNVRRVLARHFGIAGDPSAAATRSALAACAQAQLPRDGGQMPTYTQAIMDLGATVCSRRSPRCDACPVAATCVARATGQIDELPGRKPPRVARVRNAHLLLLVDKGRVLLEQRPPSGLWGGLLAPPQFDSEALLRCAAEGLGAVDARPLAPRRFQFTHYTLQCTPHLARLARPASPGVATEPLQRWLPLDGLADLPLPAPIRTLLAEI